MDLSDALGELPSGGNNQSAGPWPSNPTWPGQQPTNPSWPGQPAPNQTWPGYQPSGNPTWPGGQPAANPTWPGGSMWPGGNPGQPTAPGGFLSGPGAYGPGPGPTIPTEPQRNLVVPYEQELPQGVFDKLLISITGTIKPNAEKITVNLSTSSDIAFHFNPRFNDYGQKVLVRNTCINKEWGKEERDVKQFPFVKGQPFEMKILCTNNEFKVAVNKSHLLEYKHRITNLSSINTLGIYYDLTLSSVVIETLS
ncbi:galectin-5-like [Girardinichthys multiradiatus]|uniref:galectin-5-like n=1 Tax=Girardinichthys multiradiatus TaxID=208333 RepID=UPI001FAE4F44|nr:galectin-5-like [Girardinichthys multiradiatus]